MIKERLSIESEELLAERDAAHLGLFTPVSPDEIPPAAVELFDQKSRLLTNEPGLSPQEFDLLFALKYPDGDTTFFATFKRHGLEPDDSPVEIDTLVVDIDRESGMVGRGEIRFLLPGDVVPNMVGFPFVGMTYTEEGHTRNGLGMRRLLAMNTAAKYVYNMPLRSGLHPSPSAESLWINCVGDGLAKPPSEETNERYKFV